MGNDASCALDGGKKSVRTVAKAYEITLPADPVHLTVIGHKLFFSAGEAKEVKKGNKTKKVHQRRFYMLDTEKPREIYGFPSLINTLTQSIRW